MKNACCDRWCILLLFARPPDVPPQCPLDASLFFSHEFLRSSLHGLCVPASLPRRLPRFCADAVCCRTALDVPCRSVLSSDDSANTELDTTWAPIPLGVSLAVIDPEDVESFPAGMQTILSSQPMVDPSLPIILRVPATPNDWHESLYQSLVFVPDTSDHVYPKAGAIIPEVILSAKSSQATKAAKEKIYLAPVIFDPVATADEEKARRYCRGVE